MIQQARNVNEYVLLLDAGDSLYGTVTPAQSSRGASSVELMNMLAYDALALGAGEFSIGREVEDRIAEAQFPILSANTYVSGTGTLLTKPYVLREFGDQTVAIIGVTEVFTQTGYYATDPISAVAAAVEKVATDASVIIVLSHAGREADTQIAKQVPGIDMIVAGGLDAISDPIQDPTYGTILVHAEAPRPDYAGLYVGSGAFRFDAQGTVTDFSWTRQLITENIAQDPTIVQWVIAHP